MRSFGWTMVLLVLVFGIGWTSRVVAERDSGALERLPVEAAAEDLAGSRLGGDGPGGPRGGHHRRGGPFLSSVQEFADQLDLSSEQRAEIWAILDQTLEEVRELERSIWNVHQRSRPRMLAVLTDEQRADLERLVDDRRSEMERERIERTMKTITEATSLDDGAAARARAALEGYERRKSRFFSELCDREAWPEDAEIKDAIAEFRAERDAALADVLPADVLDRIQDRRRRRP